MKTNGFLLSGLVVLMAYFQKLLSTNQYWAISHYARIQKILTSICKNSHFTTNLCHLICNLFNEQTYSAMKNPQKLSKCNNYSEWSSNPNYSNTDKNDIVCLKKSFLQSYYEIIVLTKVSKASKMCKKQRNTHFYKENIFK